MIEQESLLSMGLKELKNLAEIMLDELPPEAEEGKLGIPLVYLTNEWYLAHPSSGKVTVQGHGKYNLIDFYEDLEQREKILRAELWEALASDKPTTPRIGE